MRKNSALNSADSWLLEQQKNYTPAQRRMAAESPHLVYLTPVRKKFSKKARRDIFDRDEGRCFHCGCCLDIDNFHIDHLMPLSAGGTDDWSNLAASCPPCNLSKGAS